MSFNRLSFFDNSFMSLSIKIDYFLTLLAAITLNGLHKVNGAPFGTGASDKRVKIFDPTLKGNRETLLHVHG